MSYVEKSWHKVNQKQEKTPPSFLAMPWVGFFYWQEDTARGLDEEGPYAHAARGGDGGHEGR